MAQKVTLGVLLALLADGPAGAAARPDAQSQLLDKLSACRKLADPTEKLSCYDREVGALEAAVARKDVVVVDRETARTTRRSLFGFNLPKLPFFDHEEAEEEISAKVTSVQSLGFGKWRIQLDGGAVWSTTEASNVLLPRAGDTVTIKRAALGSYFIKFPGARAVRGQRVG